MHTNDWVAAAFAKADRVGAEAEVRFWKMLVALLVVMVGGPAFGYWVGTRIAGGF